ncbi:MAG: BatA domain-containing protein [Planctomycetes bacterium]|nr:BatA domain-containing protein [Planctomycetota bacterium]
MFGFLNVFLVGFAALGSVPIIIHLLNKRRFRPVQWAAMEFLLTAIKQNSRRLQLRDIILMLIRTAAVVFLALALARPTIAGKVSLLGGRSNSAAVILLDNSFSMGYNNGRETRFDSARRMAKTIIERLDKGAWCALLTFNDDARSPMGDPSQNLAWIEQELEKSTFLSDGTTNVERALRKVQKIYQTQNYVAAAKELYIITDRQARAWSPKNVSSDFDKVLKELSTESSVYLVDAGDAGGENCAILDMAPSDSIVTVGMPVVFTVKIKNFGQAEVSGLNVDLYVDPTGAGDERPIERTAVNLEAGQVATVQLETNFQNGGDHRIEVRIGDDRLAADNRRYYTVEVVDETHFLLVDGKEIKPDDPRASETGYLRIGLSPVDAENPEKQSLVVSEAVPHYRIAEKNLSSYQAVILSNVERLQPVVAQQIERQVRSGMGLMIFLGDQTDPQRFNAQWGEQGLKLLPAEVQETWGEAPKIGDEKLPPSHTFAGEPDKISHPIMAAFADPDAQALLPELKIFKAFGLKPLPGDDVQVVTYFDDGKPAIVERKVGSGTVVLCAFPATTAWSNLPMRAVFPIILQRTAGRLTLGNRPPKNLPVGAEIQGYVSLADQKANIRITAPPPVGKREVTPELTQDGRARFDFGETEKAGFYDIVIDRAGFKPLAYSLNANTEAESDLSAVSPEQIKQDFPGFEFTAISKSEDLGTKLINEKQGTEIWPWFMFLVFALLVSESILAHLWAPRD